MVEIKNLSKSYGKLNILNDVSIQFEKKGITAILGPNGSGKTTIMKSILGQIIPDNGEIFVFSESVNGCSEYRNKIGYLPQIANFPENLTVSELINLIKDIRNQPSEEKRLIAYFGLETHLNKRISQLSGGTRQKVNILLTFMFDNPIMILDEPTVGLDPIARIKFKKLLEDSKAAGKLILITTHILNVVEELADHLVFLLEGNIFFNGKTQDLLANYNEIHVENAIAKIIEENEQLNKKLIS